MTKQEMFDLAAVGMLTQGEVCREGSSCRYKHKDKHCAVGFIIKSIASEEMMASIGDATALLLDFPELQEPLKDALGDSEDPYAFLMTLQRIHDKDEPQFWEENLRKFAKEYELNTDCLLPFEAKS